jgi:hypothetical protein
LRQVDPQNFVRVAVGCDDIIGRGVVVGAATDPKLARTVHLNSDVSKAGTSPPLTGIKTIHVTAKVQAIAAGQRDPIAVDFASTDKTTIWHT